MHCILETEDNCVNERTEETMCVCSILGGDVESNKNSAVFTFRAPHTRVLQHENYDRCKSNAKLLWWFVQETLVPKLSQNVMEVFNISVKSTIGGHVGVCFKGSKGQAHIPDSKNQHRSNIQSHRSLHFYSRWTSSPNYEICSYNKG